MVDAAGSRRGGTAASAGGVLAPIGLSAVAFVLLRVGSGGEPVEVSTVFAAVFLGFVAFDLALAAAMAVGRARGRGTGRPSSIVGLTLVLWFLWVATTAIPQGDGATSWTADTAAAIGVGLVCVVAEALVVRRLGRRPVQP